MQRAPPYLRGGTFKTICTTGDLRMSMTIGPEKFVKAPKNNHHMKNTQMNANSGDCTR